MPNRLADATSPYLLQHKDNPVDWHEWGEEAFAEARERDVPVLLSVGYSACHWCHVMAHESFEDPEIAAEMNRHFVNVKVDREERPDVDAVYMEAVQAMSGHGGWPMTVWMTPDGRPFYAGTYFPKTDRRGMPSFRRVMATIADAWDHQRGEVIDQSDRLSEAVKRTIPTATDLPEPALLEQAYRGLVGTFDPVHGGFGGAPKFPQQPILEYLLRIRSEPWAERADEMVSLTLGRMADGGIHDQLGGGFARYSVDRIWLVPHFEKMLYDNAQLARLYLWAGVELGKKRFLDVCRSTLDYMIADLSHPEGGFFSAEDADSEGVEGKFYVWSAGEMKDILGDDFEAAARFFGVTEQGNFEGSNILHRATEEPWSDTIETIRQRLLVARENRVRPGLDDKVIASWNGLAIRALAEAGAALGEERYVQAARQAADFMAANLIFDGSLMRSWREGRTSGRAFLDDYASTAVGLFALYAATAEPRWYEQALRLVDGLTEFDNPQGGFYTTPADGESLLKRPVDLTDNPLPSGNSLAAEALLMAGLLTGDGDYQQSALEALRAAGLLAERFPSMVGHHLSVLHAVHRGTKELAIVGDSWRDLAGAYWDRFRPHIALAPSAGEASEPPLLDGRAVTGKTVAYVCQNFSCRLPTEDPEELATQLG